MNIYVIINIIVLLLLFLCIVYVVSFAFNKVMPKNNNIYIKESKLGGKYGRGVFAASDIEEGTFVEIVPYIEDDDKKFIGIIKDYVFTKGNSGSKIGVIPFGYACIYNHMDEPNTKWFIEEQYFFIKAVKPIKKDEEIFVSYGSKYWNTRKINKVE
jgi:hypothetical protein